MSDQETSRRGVDRRALLFAALASGTALAQPPKPDAPQKEIPKEREKAPSVGVTVEMIERAEWTAGLSLTPDERKEILEGVNRDAATFKRLREGAIDNSVAPAVQFNPSFASSVAETNPTIRATPMETSPAKKPNSADELAFSSVAQLSSLIRTGQATSVELTRLYLERLKRLDPKLYCVVTLMEKHALAAAEAADNEIKAGRYRGPLHGVPWGAKDLISFPGFPTTWGAEQFKNRILDVKATVAKRLEDAGAVLVAKLSLGALAMGDKWYGGMTRNPWNPKDGSSGSSAGSSAASAAGLVGFAIGSETLGSIVSPCRRCGATGLRPTFGRVSRHGCMALSWSMDKIGPIARTIEDCALIFAAITGADGHDATAVTRSFVWPCATPLASIKVGYIAKGRGAAKDADLEVLRKLGVTLVPIDLPPRASAGSLMSILSVEAASAFDELTRKKITASLNEWPRIFRQSQFISGVEYVRANRLRTQLAGEMAKIFEKIDCYIEGDDLAIANLTGHPTVVMPHTFVKVRGIEVPGSITFTGNLFGEDKLLAVAHAFQTATGHHLRHPPLKV
jgi:Asp-tRNA(Asn)/Glu-tRNA(Gln) amidotransferase A subunit family amidase